MHVDPFVFERRKPALDLLEIGEIVDLAEIRKSSCVRMRKALICVSASPHTPSSSTTAVPYQVVLVSVTESGSITWMWLPRIERFGKNTLMLTGSDEARSSASSARLPSFLRKACS